MEVFTLQKKQGRFVTFLGNFLRVHLHDYLLLPQSKLLAGKIQHYKRCSNKKAKHNKLCPGEYSGVLILKQLFVPS